MYLSNIGDYIVKHRTNIQLETLDMFPPKYNLSLCMYPEKTFTLSDYK